MTQLLGLVILSFFVTSIFLVPFIDFLFYLKRKFQKKLTSKLKSETPIHDQLMKKDKNIPSGAGVLLILILVTLNLGYAFFSSNPDIKTLTILILTLILFGVLGVVDDIKLIFTKREGKFLGLGRKEMFFIQIIFAIFISSLIYFLIGLNNLYIPIFGNLIIDFWYIPLAAFIIISFANAYNISDGLDGLSAGLLTICLFAFLTIVSRYIDLTLASFIGIWIGSLFAFLYFNIWPARIFLGDAGSFAFGATLAVVGLLTGKILALAIIGGVFVIIIASSLIQIITKKFLQKKVLPVAPIHMYFKYIGWPEAKIVFRFWLAQSLFAIFGIWIALLSK